MSALSAGHCPRTVKQSALYGLRTAFLHVTAACEEKWECKWKRGMYGPKNRENWRKDYLNYLKRKKRAEAKRDLLKWHSMDISAIDFVEACESGSTRSFSEEKKHQNDGRTYSYRWSSKTGRSSTHKQHKRSFDKEGERWYEGFSSGPFHFFWNCDTSYQNQTWGRAWESFSHENTSWQETSSFKSEQAQNEKLKTQKAVGSSTDRQTLGLSSSGPLTVEELKKAFRLSALKWHPDRHQGSAKAIAEAKFKHCGAAYKSLLDALASA